MVLVHLIDQGAAVPWLVGEVAMHWLRFAAGGFIFASGLCVGAIHFRKSLQPGRRLGIHGSLWQRAGIVLLAHYFTAFLLLLEVPLGGTRDYHVADYVRDVLLFWTGYDLLLFYVVMLLLSPLLIELRRLIGPLPLLLASLSLFFVFHDRPYLMLYPLENHFPILHWQAVFVTGFVTGTLLPSYDAMTRTTKRRLWLVASVVAVAISMLSLFERQTGMTPPPWLTVSKLPLSYLELARYLALAVVVAIGIDLAWKHLRGGVVERWLALAGSYSLLLWVVHAPMISAVRSLPWLAAATVAVLVVLLAAKLAKEATRAYAARFPSGPRLGLLSPVLGSLVVIAMLHALSQPGIDDADLLIAHADHDFGILVQAERDDSDVVHADEAQGDLVSGSSADLSTESFPMELLPVIDEAEPTAPRDGAPPPMRIDDETFQVA
jgi:hypothetical protein